MDLLLRCLLKLRTSFSSARDDPILKDLLRLPWWLLRNRFCLLIIIKLIIKIKCSHYQVTIGHYS